MRDDLPTDSKAFCDPLVTWRAVRAGLGPEERTIRRCSGQRQQKHCAPFPITDVGGQDVP
jgi:hypothetical protein